MIAEAREHFNSRSVHLQFGGIGECGKEFGGESNLEDTPHPPSSEYHGLILKLLPSPDLISRSPARTGSSGNVMLSTTRILPKIATQS